MSQLWQHRERLEHLAIKVMVITFEPLNEAASRQFPYYSDSNRQLYRYFGMFQADFFDLWGPRTLLIYLKLLLKGRKILRSDADVQQQGGDVVIDPHGRIRFHHVGRGPADRPDLEKIFRVVEKGMF